jgi:beta-glucosidase
MPAFPEGFVWGAATAAHQVEGGNWNSDWWAWEHFPGSPCVEPSGDACDHYHRYQDDIRLLAELGFNAYRFSLEWSRIEPEDGHFSTAALEHYKRVCEYCRDHGVTPVVTFHHFSTPRWAAHRGGWWEPSMVGWFTRYAERAAAHLGDCVGWACTINEPNIVSLMGYHAGVFPPGRNDPAVRREVDEVLIEAHRHAGAAIRAATGAPTGLALSMAEFVAVDGGDERLEATRRRREDIYLEAVGGDDFIGVQTYSRTRVGPHGDAGPEHGVERTQMGYEFWPTALGVTIRRAADLTGLPVLVTENGIGTDDDTRRVAYTTAALQCVQECLAEGIDVRGYIHWSLLDNFEWVLGYQPTFGLVAVDRATQERGPKPSASWLGAIARANRFDG